MRNRNAFLKAGAYVGFIGAAVFIVHAVFTSTSSTAPIGLLLIPVYGFPAAGVGWALVYIIFALLDLRSGRSSWKSKQMFSLFGLANLLLARRWLCSTESQFAS